MSIFAALSRSLGVLSQELCPECLEVRQRPAVRRLDGSLVPRRQLLCQGGLGGGTQGRGNPCVTCMHVSMQDLLGGGGCCGVVSKRTNSLRVEKPGGAVIAFRHSARFLERDQPAATKPKSVPPPRLVSPACAFFLSSVEFLEFFFNSRLSLCTYRLNRLSVLSFWYPLFYP